MTSFQKTFVTMKLIWSFHDTFSIYVVNPPHLVWFFFALVPTVICWSPQSIVTRSNTTSQTAVQNFWCLIEQNRSPATISLSLVIENLCLLILHLAQSLLIDTTSSHDVGYQCGSTIEFINTWLQCLLIYWCMYITKFKSSIGFS